MAQIGHSISSMHADMIRVAWLAAGLAGSLPAATVALPVSLEQATGSDEAVVSGLWPLQATAALTGDPGAAAPVSSDAPPYPQRASESPSGRIPPRDQLNRNGVLPASRGGLAAESAALGLLGAPMADPPQAHEGRGGHVVALSDFLQLDDADEAQFRQAARIFVESTSEAMPWLRPTLETIRGVISGGETSEFFQGWSTSPSEWLGRPIMHGVAMAGAGSFGIAEPGARLDAALIATARQPDELERNVVRELISKTRRLLDQPLSWFILTLMLIGWVAVSAAKKWLR